MRSIGIRELKNKLSSCVRRIEAGERIAVTVHGRVVVELVPPTKGARAGLETGDPLEGWRDIRLPRGTAAKLINSDRDEG